MNVAMVERVFCQQLFLTQLMEKFSTKLGDPCATGPLSDLLGF